MFGEMTYRQFRVDVNHPQGYVLIVKKEFHMRLNFADIQNGFNQILPKTPDALGMVLFASTSAVMARQCVLIAKDCTIDWQGLYNAIITEKGLKTACKVGFLGCSIFSQNSTIANIAVLGLGMTATGLLAYNYGQKLFQPKKAIEPKSDQLDLSVPPISAIVPNPDSETDSGVAGVNQTDK
jgi:hypothetical protein